MSYTTELKIEPETIRTFVRAHMARYADTDERYLASGFRVKFGRPMLANEAAIASEVYGELDRERKAKLAAEEADWNARKPKGFQRILASSWRSQALVGTVGGVAALFYFAGLDIAMQVMFWIVGFTQGIGFFPLVGAGWAVAASVVWVMRKLFRYTVPVPPLKAR